MSFRFWVSLGVCVVLAAAPARAAVVPVGFVDRQVAGGLSSPTALTALPDGRLLVLQQNGVIYLIEDDVLQKTHFWDVPDVDSSAERGCLGITPDPNFAENHYIYLFCTIQTGTSNNHVIRVTERDGRVDSGSAKNILELPPVHSEWHMGGALRFGSDGMLYVASGNAEDLPQPASSSNSQNLSNPFGKILRIRSDGSVPSDNPFSDRSGAYDAIWSYGYRNPFAFDIQPGTGRMFVGDVGQATWEEINDNKRGGNYGWPIVEGADPRYESPFYGFQHRDGRCAITGGAFYNPPKAQFPSEYVGTFLFEEFCGGTIEVLDTNTAKARPFASGIGFPTNLTIAPDGSLYYLSRNQDTKTHQPGVGALGKITYTGTALPRISKNPVAQTIVLGDPVTFSVEVAGEESIQWQRDGQDISGATGESYTIPSTTAADDGAVFTAVATNGVGSVKSTPVRLTITTNRPPMAAITASSPEYVPGDSLTFNGSGSDAEDGELPDSAFTWQIDFQHDVHVHPLVAAASGSRTQTFKVPDLEASDANVWVRVHLSVRDSGGASHSTFRDVFPSTQLSALTPLDPAQNGWGPFERDRSNGEAGMDGKPLAIDGNNFLRGIGVHAPSDLRYHLGGSCNGKFVADIGIDDEVGNTGSVVFRVFLDDQLAYDSGVKRGSDARTAVSLDVAGKTQLRLVVTDAEDGKTGDHADWAAARITGCREIGKPPLTPTEPGSPAADGGTMAPGAADAGAAKGGAGAAAPSEPDQVAGRAAAGSTTSPTPSEPGEHMDAGAAAKRARDAGGLVLPAANTVHVKQPSGKRSDGGCAVTRLAARGVGGGWMFGVVALGGIALRRRVRRV